MMKLKHLEYIITTNKEKTAGTFCCIC